MTIKWKEVNDLSSGQYFDSKNMGFKTSVLRSNLFAYIVHILLQVLKILKVEAKC